jgi:hypothetical protein
VTPSRRCMPTLQQAQQRRKATSRSRRVESRALSYIVGRREIETPRKNSYLRFPGSHRAQFGLGIDMFSRVFSKIPEIVMRNPSVLGQPVGGGNGEDCVRFDTLGCDGRRLSMGGDSQRPCTTNGERCGLLHRSEHCPQPFACPSGEKGLIRCASPVLDAAGLFRRLADRFRRSSNLNSRSKITPPPPSGIHDGRRG